MAGVRGSGWFHVLWNEPSRSVSACRHLCGQDPQRRQARGPSRRAANQVRTGDQPQDGEGARSEDPAASARTGGSGYRAASSSGQPSGLPLSRCPPTTARSTLSARGWTRGEARFADGKFDRLPAFAEELLHLNVSLIVAANSPGAHAAISATKIVPIVMVEVG